MPLKNDRLSRSLEHAKLHLDNYVTLMDAQKVEEKLRRRDPRWRKLSTDVRNIEGRMEAVAALAARDAAVLASKSETAGGDED